MCRLKSEFVKLATNPLSSVSYRFGLLGLKHVPAHSQLNKGFVGPNSVCQAVPRKGLQTGSTNRPAGVNQCIAATTDKCVKM